MAIRRASKSSISTTGTSKRFNLIAGYSPAQLSMEPIATVTVGSGGASSIEFSSIPGTYQHLQLRYTVRSARVGNTRDNMLLRVGNNSIDTGNNYAFHFLQGLGTSAGTGGNSSISYALLGYAPGSSATASTFGVGIVDIIDYANTSKTKVSRALSGTDDNGNPNLGIDFSSGLWNNTSAINTVRIYAFNADLVQYSTATLYGVKA